MEMSSTTFIQKVVVFGAGGQLGRHVLRHLLAAPEFTVTILTGEDSTSKFPLDVKVVRSNFTAESLVAALKNQDAVVTTVSHMALGRQELVLRAAVIAGVRRFLPSEYGGDTACEGLLQAAPFTAIKRRVTDKLRELQGQGPESQFSWTSVVSGPFFEWCIESQSFGFDLQTRTAILYDGGCIPFATTKLATIAAFVVGVLRNPGLAENRYVYVRSALVTQRELLVALEQRTGETWKVEHLRAQNKRRHGLARIEAGDFMGNLDLIEAAILTPGTGFDFQSMNTMFGIPGDETVADLVQEALT